MSFGAREVCLTCFSILNFHYLSIEHNNDNYSSQILNSIFCLVSFFAYYIGNQLKATGYVN